MNTVYLFCKIDIDIDMYIWSCINVGGGLKGCSWKNVEPVEEDDGQRLNEMGPATEGGVDSKAGPENFTKNRRHQSLTSIDSMLNVKKKKTRDVWIKKHQGKERWKEEIFEGKKRDDYIDENGGGCWVKIMKKRLEYTMGG